MPFLIHTHCQVACRLKKPTHIPKLVKEYGCQTRKDTSNDKARKHNTQ